MRRAGEELKRGVADDTAKGLGFGRTDIVAAAAAVMHQAMGVECLAIIVCARVSLLNSYPITPNALPVCNCMYILEYISAADSK